MHLAVVLHVLVVGPQQTRVPIGVQAGDLVDAGADRARAQGPAQPGQTFLPLQIERGRQRVAPLAHNGASTRPGPVPVGLGVRSAVGLFPHHPQDLALGGVQNFPLLLNGGRVDPVFGIHEPASRSGGCLPHPPRACQGFLHHRFLGEAASVEVRLSGTEVTGERLFHDNVLVGFEGLNGHGLVHIGRRADIHHIHGIQQALQGIEGLEPVDAGKSLGAFPGAGHDPRHLQRDAEHLPVAGQVKTGGELGPHDADSNFRMHECLSLEASHWSGRWTGFL